MNKEIFIMSTFAHTYSILAYDPHLHQFGVAVQSHWFCVGALVPWAEPGIGAVATQSFVEVCFGPLGLDLMRAGKTAEQALQGLLASDPDSAVRQVAMVDAQGNVAAHTGERCIAEAGHRLGKNYAVQANLMLQDTVWDAMAQAYESSPGDLAARMLASLEAAQAESGDIRGQQSTALLVVSAALEPAPWSGRIFDLRVDDHPQPLMELRRLLAVSRAYQHAQTASQLLEAQPLAEQQLAQAAREFQLAADTPEMQHNPELLFWQAVDLVVAEQFEAALPLFKQVFELDPIWRELLPRLVPAELLPDDPALIERIFEGS
jgi:uncharacterized Ntn-hydrolase superfamily protein